MNWVEARYDSEKVFSSSEWVFSIFLLSFPVYVDHTPLKFLWYQQNCFWFFIEYRTDSYLTFIFIFSLSFHLITYWPTFIYIFWFSYRDEELLWVFYAVLKLQEWKFRKENRTAIYNMAAGLCLVAEEPRRHGAKITMEVCSNNLSYIWNLIVIHGEL